MSLITYYPLTESSCYQAYQKITPTKLMLHSTGANNKYLHRYIAPDDGKLGPNAYGNHWNQPGAAKCSHGFFGALQNGEIACYQTLPFEINGWHAGGNANQFAIGFEICEGGDDTEYFAKVYDYAVRTFAELCKTLSFTVNDITSHVEEAKKGNASNHSDPESYFNKFGKSMDTFRNDVYNILKGDIQYMFTIKLGSFETEQEAKNFLSGMAAMFDGASVVSDSKPTPEPTPDPQPSFKVGDAVKIKSGYNTFIDGKTMSSWVTKSKLYIRQLEQNNTVALVSTEPEKDSYTGRMFCSILEPWSE